MNFVSNDAKNPPAILIIAGSDSCGGAGIQADIKTATSLSVYCASVVTCVTAQNSVGVGGVKYLPANFVAKQLQLVLEDMNFAAIKIGMVGNSSIIKAIANVINNFYQNLPPFSSNNYLPKPILIVDPVMISTSGHLLLKNNAINSLQQFLIRNSYLVTPNIDEAQILSQIKITNLSQIKEAAQIIKAKFKPQSVLIKGGHLANFSQNNPKNKPKQIFNLLLDENNQFSIIKNLQLQFAGSNQIHGTGCTLASAIACNLAKKQNLLNAVKNANSFVFRAAKKSFEIGRGSRILHHF